MKYKHWNFKKSRLIKYKKSLNLKQEKENKPNSLEKSKNHLVLTNFVFQLKSKAFLLIKTSLLMGVGDLSSIIFQELFNLVDYQFLFSLFSGC